MSLGLEQLSACFEGVIPSVIATTAADGTPNVSYLSQVMQVDDSHVALSNQFFAKTSANVRANPLAALLLVCPRTGDQFHLDLVWEAVADHGPVFDRIDRALSAAIAQTGMATVMRLKAVDIFRVEAVREAPSALLRNEVPAPSPGPTMRDFSTLVASLAEQGTSEEVCQALLASACAFTDCQRASVLRLDPEGAALVTVATTGGPVGGPVPLGQGLLGQAAASAATLKINDLSRVRRMGQSVANGGASFDKTGSDASDAAVLSQIAVPLTGRKQVLGVLYVESERRLAFDDEVTAGLETLAAQAGAALALLEGPIPRPTPAAPPLSAMPAGPPISIKVHRFDDSVFVNGEYVIKGVAGRALVFMIERALAEGRTTFSNREIRRVPELRLPDFKDNLETRLLLLARRLDEKSALVRLQRTGRGVMELQMVGKPTIEYVD